MSNDVAEKICWMGRTAASADGSIRLGFPGVTAFFRFSGRSIAWQKTATSPDCFFNVSIDGGPDRIVRAEVGPGRLVLAEGLAEGVHDVHDVRVVRRSESWQGTIDIHGVEIDPPGELLDPPPLPERKLLFIGDSITAGAAVDFMEPDWPQGHITGDAGGSFGMVLGERLSAQVHLVGYGGRGLVRDYQGLTQDKTLVAPAMFERAMPDEADSVWDHSAYQPDAVIIGVGQNDFSIGIPDEKLWTAAYEMFLSRIRAVHPAALIVLTNSPMFSARVDNGDFARSAAIDHYLDEVLALRTTAGDENVAKVMYRHQPGSGKNSHPIRPQHQLMADDLEPVLRTRLNW